MKTYRKNGRWLTSRTCEVCGCNLPSGRGLTTTTCDHTCTKAKHYGVSREIMVEREVMSAGSYRGLTREHLDKEARLKHLDMGGHSPALTILNNLP